jgi:energy-coupling factor transporter ATP-binding protein EcfA2
MRCDPIGSVWRLWDLHFHTPVSFDYRGNRKTSPGDIAEALVQAGISVVAVTDHHRIDVEFIRAMQDAAGDSLTVMPGIELRTELGGRYKIHMVAIFSEDADMNHLWTSLQGPLHITPHDIESKGDEAVWVKFEEACELIHELHGFVSVHAGTKSNSLELCLPSEVKLNREIKRELVLAHVDAFELGKVSDSDAYRSTIFPNLDRAFPLVLCSDNHDYRNLAFKAPMWIKGDPGFRGLLQARNEPASRVWLGECPPLLARTRASATKYISGVSFTKIDASVADSWFSGTVALNPGLVAVIGNKGGGKSALADVLALAGNSSAQDDFAFLNKDHFLRARGGFGSAFEASTSWLSGEVRTCRLDASVDWFSPELVKYLPQSYLEDLCAKVREPGVSGFEQELQEVIYSHVGAAQRLGKPSLTELIDYVTTETAQGIQQLARQISQVNASILQLEDQATPEFRTTLQGKLDQRLAEAAAHDAARSAPVPEPKLDDATQLELAKVSATVSTLRKELGAVDKSIAEIDVADQDASEVIAAADRLGTRIANLVAEYEYFLQESEEDLAILGLSASDVIALSTPGVRLGEVEAKAKEERARAAELLNPTVAGSIAARRQEFLNALGQELPKLDEPGIRYQEFLEAEKRWLDEHVLVVGSAEAPDTILGLQERLRALEGLPDRILDLAEKRGQLVAEIFRAKRTLLDKYGHLYRPVQAFIGRQGISSDDQSRLEFSARIVVDGFADAFLAHIHQGHRGTFLGDAEGREVADRLVASADFDTEAGALNFVHQVIGLLAKDARTGSSVRLRDQIVQGTTPAEVLDYLCGLEYLRPRFELLWNGKTLTELSPGERGTLLLLFYLLVDLRDVPLIIDQPEENLDNQTVYAVLVQAVREASQRRQIILVTHNPNLAVVCDADQIVYAHRDAAQGNLITYTTGALENPEITKFVVDVLEGTHPAFKKRDAKYGILYAG